MDYAAAIRKDVAELTQRHHMSRALSAEIETLVERAKALGSPAGHGHHDEGPMPWMSMPTVINRPGEPQPELHIGWADIYLDLILVGVAFNGGLLLKHAFYLCAKQLMDEAPPPPLPVCVVDGAAACMPQSQPAPVAPPSIL